MPTLNWIGKEAVVNHHQQVPFHLLKDVPDLACGDPGSGKPSVQGDNLPNRLFYGKQITVCLRFLAKGKAVEFDNNARLFGGEPQLSLVA